MKKQSKTTPSLLDAVRAVPIKSSLDNFDEQTRAQVVEVAKEFVAGNIRISKLQILKTLSEQGVILGRFSFDRLIESVRAGVTK